MKGDCIKAYFDKTVIQQYKSDVAFRTLVDSVNDNMYIIPKYQRKYRWDKAKVEGLVESLLRGLPIPPIYTCRNKENQLEILDGQQRVMSLFFYYIGYFLNRKKSSAINFSKLEVGTNSFKEALMEQFPMEKLHIDLQGEDGETINVDYADLPIEMKRKVDYTTITIIEIKIDQHQDRERILKSIFANLNRGGVLLSDQEQRNGIYNCDFYDRLKDFNVNNTRWRAIWGREDSKERDMETLLRLCALKKYAIVNKENFWVERYNSSITKMLDGFSEEVMNFDDNEIQQYISSLTEFVKLFDINMTFSSKVTLLESIYVVFEKRKIKVKITKEIYDKILNTQDYTVNSRQGTVKMKNMNERWKAVYGILSDYN